MAINQIRGNIQTIAGKYSSYSDGNLNRTIAAIVPPSVVVMGTSAKGPVNKPLIFNADNIDTAFSVYGSSGTLLKQIQEVQSKGVTSILTLRIGASNAQAQHIGSDWDGITPATIPDDSGYRVRLRDGGLAGGEDFGIAFEVASGRLVVEDKVNGIVVYDNDLTSPIDLGIVYVDNNSGSALGANAANILAVGSVAGPLTTVALKDLAGLPAANPPENWMAYRAGKSGLGASRMEVFEGMMLGFLALEGYSYDYIVAPEGATLDCPSGTQAATAWGGNSSYPATKTSLDVLGKVFIEEIEGTYAFYWDVDGDDEAEFTSLNDGVDYSLVSAGGTTFSATSFLDPSFAYAIAYHCFRATLEDSFVQSCVGVEPPAIGTPLSAWTGTKPTLTTALSGAVTVTANGTGLLGNKYMGGNTAFRSAHPYGGFVQTDEPYFDSGTEINDSNGLPVDLGKFMTVWITPELFQPKFDVNLGNAYTRVSPAAYMAFREGLLPGQTPTNKPYAASGTVLTGALNRSQIADLTEMRYTFAKQDQFGVKIVDGPSASLPESDYNRQGTMEILQVIDQGIRETMEPFLGRILSQEEELSIQTELNELVNTLKGARLVSLMQVKFVRSEQERILGVGRALTKVKIPSELKQIFQETSLTR